MPNARSIHRFAHVVILFLACCAPASARPEFPRPPLCTIQQAKSQDFNSLQNSFRSKFCTANGSDSCSERWENGKQFLEKALTDPRIVDVGTIAYMFGTIYAETEIKNFSPHTEEIIGPKNKDRKYVKEGFYGRGWIQLTHEYQYKLA